MRIQSWLFILSILLLSIGCFQSKQTVLQAENTFSDKKVRLMFYNVENLFDTENDSLTNDDEFLPDGAKYWTPFKYREKLTHIYKVFAAVGQWQGVDIAGLCEVENLKVLEDLVNTTPLKSVGYKILHKNSTDPRGIDVAILYNPATVKVLYYNAVPVLYPESSGRGRDILHAVFTTPGNDTLHFYVNHWPSRFSGHIETEEKRLAAALTLKRHSDSVMLAQPGAKIVITGDFNDHPTDGSFVYGLQTINTFDNPIGNKLYNVSYYLQETKLKWSYKHQGIGGILDQIIVSGALLTAQNGVSTNPDLASTGEFDFLLEDDNYYPGLKPFRTYIGYKYNEGYSDHLPVYIDLILR